MWTEIGSASLQSTPPGPLGASTSRSALACLLDAPFAVHKAHVGKAGQYRFVGKLGADHVRNFGSLLLQDLQRLVVGDLDGQEDLLDLGIERGRRC